MASAQTLPASIECKLSSLSTRVRLLRSLRGISLLGIALVVIAAAAFLADFAFELSVVGRIAVMAGGVMAGFSALIVGLVLPGLRRLDEEALAAAVEQHYPELGERLTTSVELATRRHDYHGAGALVDML